VDQPVLQEILLNRVRGESPALEPVLDAAELQDLFTAVDAVLLPSAVANYISRLVAATHPKSAAAPPSVRDFVKYGSSPRGAIAIGTARGLALLHGKPNAGFDEVRSVAAPALAHRLVLDYAAKLEGWDGRRIVGALLHAIPEVERGLPQSLEA
jgi:MoxR-like ATPase